MVTPPLFAVADGMGGHAAGEVASEIAVNVLAEQAPAHPDAERARQRRRRSEPRRACSGVPRRAWDARAWATTCTAAMLEGERLVIAQVGDSRAYLLHQGKLQQLTARPQPDGRHDRGRPADPRGSAHAPPALRHHARARAATRIMQPDLYEINVETGDRLLLCSDGLSTMVQRRGHRVPHSAHRATPQRCASQLVNEAIAAGGHDNVTVIVADVDRLRRTCTARRWHAKTKLTRSRSVHGAVGRRRRRRGLARMLVRGRTMPPTWQQPGRQGGYLPRRARQWCWGMTLLALASATTDVSAWTTCSPGTGQPPAQQAPSPPTAWRRPRRWWNRTGKTSRSRRAQTAPIRPAGPPTAALRPAARPAMRTVRMRPRPAGLPVAARPAARKAVRRHDAPQPASSSSCAWPRPWS